MNAEETYIVVTCLSFFGLLLAVIVFLTPKKTNRRFKFGYRDAETKLYERNRAAALRSEP